MSPPATPTTTTYSCVTCVSVRNYDIPTAVSVLTTGTYTRLPSLIQEMFTRDDRLRDEQVIATMGELDDVMRWRLACVEVVPKRMLWKVGESLRCAGIAREKKRPADEGDVEQGMDEL